MILILIMLVSVFVFMQFIILATVGTKGSEITEIRAQKEVLRIENDALRSEIDKVKVLDKIEASVDELFNFRRKNVVTIYGIGYGENRYVGELP